MARAYDGEAKVWLEQDRLCFGGEQFKTKGLFFNKNLGVDETEVFVYGVEVARTGEGAFWSAVEKPVKARPLRGIRLRSNTCIEYGAAITGFAEMTQAKPLGDGLYSVSLSGSDLKSNSRALFYKQFCIKGSGKALQLKSPTYDDTLHRWSCDDG